MPFRGQEVTFDEFAVWWTTRCRAVSSSDQGEAGFTKRGRLLQRGKDCFDRLDADGSGALDLQEFELLLEELAKEDEWIEHTDAQGKTYFRNRRTKEVGQGAPPESRQIFAAAAVSACCCCCCP